MEAYMFYGSQSNFTVSDPMLGRFTHPPNTILLLSSSLYPYITM